MRWLTVILVVIISSCLGLFTSYATVDMLLVNEKTISPNPEDNIIGIDESDGSDMIITDAPKKEETETVEAAEPVDTTEITNISGTNPNDQNDTFDEQAEEAKPYKLFLVMGTDVVYSG